MDQFGFIYLAQDVHNLLAWLAHDPLGVAARVVA